MTPGEAPMTNDVTRVAHADLVRFITSAYHAVGIPAADAEKAAELMAASDISGADGHGVFRLPEYIRRIKAGGLNTNPEITIIRHAKAAAIVDGDDGLGSLVVARAVEEAIALASDNGVGWVGTRNGNHAGAAAVYAAMPVAHDMIGLYFAVGNANHLPPWGGIDMLLSTNPIAVAVPALAEPPLILDMARTVAAYAKVKLAAQQGKAMPEGWMIDRQGEPLIDPNRADDGCLLPLAVTLTRQAEATTAACELLSSRPTNADSDRSSAGCRDSSTRSAPLPYLASVALRVALAVHSIQAARAGAADRHRRAMVCLDRA